MMWWIRTRRFSIKESLSLGGGELAAGLGFGRASGFRHRISGVSQVFGLQDAGFEQPPVEASPGLGARGPHLSGPSRETVKSRSKVRRRRRGRARGIARPLRRVVLLFVFFGGKYFQLGIFRKAVLSTAYFLEDSTINWVFPGG